MKGLTIQPAVLFLDTKESHMMRTFFSASCREAGREVNWGLLPTTSAKLPAWDGTSTELDPRAPTKPADAILPTDSGETPSHAHPAKTHTSILTPGIQQDVPARWASGPYLQVCCQESLPPSDLGGQSTGGFKQVGRDCPTNYVL